MESKSQRAISIVEIVFYIFIFVGVLGFLICWLIYIAKLNTEINEAIRMLNMIPFKLLSNARRETREFIVWIIREANMKNHQINWIRRLLHKLTLWSLWFSLLRYKRLRCYYLFGFRFIKMASCLGLGFSLDHNKYYFEFLLLTTNLRIKLVLS